MMRAMNARVCADGQDSAPGRPSWQWFVLAAGLLGYYCVLAATRRVDGDEGFLLYAARLVMHDHVPYRDFFYPQMALLPYLLGLVTFPVGGVGWVSGRFSGALIA